MFNIVQKATFMAQNLIKEVIEPGDVVVDATLGNGKDTLFLRRLVYEGRVYAFDIQRNAIDKFDKYISDNKINNIITVNDGHQNMDAYIKEPPKCIMFNLGYLPGGDENIKTLPQTTLTAVSKGLEILKQGGLMTIIVYTGHKGGREEADAVLNLLENLDSKIYSAMVITYQNKNANAPFLIVIEKNNSGCANK